MSNKTTIAVLPGTGNMGFGLAWRLAKDGHNIIIGSREASKSEEAKQKILADFPNVKIVSGRTDDLDLSSAEYVILALQNSIEGQIEDLKKIETKLNGKIVVDITNIYYKDYLTQPKTVNKEKESSTEMNRKIIPGARWVAGFEATSHFKLKDEHPTANFYSDDKDALDKVKNLFEATGVETKTGSLIESREDELYIYNLATSYFQSNTAFFESYKPYFNKT